MTTTLSIIAFGFVLGMRHAMDGDHVIAVSTIVSHERSFRKAAYIGVLWGVGHTVTVMIAGGVIIVFDLAIPEQAGMTLELFVAIMLIILGAVSLKRTIGGINHSFTKETPELHSHVHAHGDYAHDHLHGHTVESHGHREDAIPTARIDRWFGGTRGYAMVRPLVVGIVHGLAGSAALALLLLPVIKDSLFAILYLFVFGVGTIAGMIMATAAIAVPFAYTATRSSGFNKALRFATSIISLGFGLFLFYEIGFVGGLFTR